MLEEIRSQSLDINVDETNVQESDFENINK
jgi:hypothetical protein